MPGESTWERFEEKDWDEKKIKDGTKPFLVPKNDPVVCCPAESHKAEIFKKPWHNVGFIGAGQAEWYTGW